jgi:hypothetical protein
MGEMVSRPRIAFSENDQQPVNALHSRHLDPTFEFAQLIRAGRDDNAECIIHNEGVG